MEQYIIMIKGKHSTLCTLWKIKHTFTVNLDGVIAMYVAKEIIMKIFDL